MPGLIGEPDLRDAVWLDIEDDGDGIYTLARYTIIIPDHNPLRPSVVPAGGGGAAPILGTLIGVATSRDTLGDCTLVMAWWMIYTHRTLARNRNTAYAYEGIIYAYRLAKTRNLKMAASDLASTIDKGLYKLTGWQVGGPLENLNPYLLDHPTDDTLAVGGVMNHKAEAPLRIDVTQHQMHAVILALENLYTDDTGT